MPVAGGGAWAALPVSERVRANLGTWGASDGKAGRGRPQPADPRRFPLRRKAGPPGSPRARRRGSPGVPGARPSNARRRGTVEGAGARRAARLKGNLRNAFGSSALKTEVTL